MPTGASDYIAIASLALNIMIGLVGGTWGISKITGSLQSIFQKELEEHKLYTNKEIKQLKDHYINYQMDAERKVGETMSAIREKIREVELFTRDNFVRDRVFQDMMRLLTTNMDTRFTQIQTTLTQLNEKIDRVIERGV